MTSPSTFTERLKTALASLPLDDEAFRAFHAAYLANCGKPHLGEAIAGAGTPDSVLSALQWALRHREAPCPPPADAEENPGSGLTEEFRALLLDSVERIDPVILGFAAKEVADGDDGAHLGLLRGSFWYYVLSAQCTDPF